MLYKEKVIQGLEHCMSESRCYKCPYTIEAECENSTSYYSKAIEDAITLLLEHEPVKPVKEQIFSSIYGWVCGACSFPLLSDSYTYCPRCGRAVKWNT